MQKWLDNIGQPELLPRNECIALFINSSLSQMVPELYSGVVPLGDDLPEIRGVRASAYVLVPYGPGRT